MESISYPTRNGIPISPLEMYDLQDSHLNLEAQRNWNLHHNCWERKQFGKHILYLTVRQIETNQLFMPCDVHDELHQVYEPPKLPTPLQAMHEVERAMDSGERLRIRQPAKKVGKYVLESITEETLKRCKASYDHLIRG